MAHTSPTIPEARCAVLTVAMTLVASIIASAAVVTGVIAVTHGGAAASKNNSSYWTAVTLKESGKVVPIKRVVRLRSDQLPITHSATAAARPQILRNFMRSLAALQMSHPLSWFARLTGGFFLLAFRSFEFDLAMGRGNINQHLGG
jgi:hypothetical protein